MNKNKLVGLAVVVAVVIAGGVFLFIKSPPGSALIPSGLNLGSGLSAQPKGFATREAAPQNIVVPDQNSKDVPEGVAVPQAVSPASQVSDASSRTFSIKIENNAFTPDTVIVHKLDVVNLVISAVDKDYDWTQPDYGLKIQILKGTSRTLQFQTYLDGKFTFFCSACGGPESGPVGYIIAAP